MQANRLHDGRYVNWVRTSLSLLYFKQGLAGFSDEKAAELHKNISESVKLKSPRAATSSCSKCSHKSAKKTKTADKKNTTWRMDCVSNVCNIWLDDILPYHEYFPCPYIAWKNSDPQRWRTHPWEVAKLFQPYGCKKHTNATDADCQALLRLFMDCKFFRTFLPDTATLDQINTLRNDCFHSKDMLVSDADMRLRLNLLVSVLEEPALRGRPACQDARTKIKELRDNKLDLSLNKEQELIALDHKITSVRCDVDCLSAQLHHLQASLTDVTTRQDSADEVVKTIGKQMQDLILQITELKSNLEGQQSDPDIGTKMADFISQLETLKQSCQNEIQILQSRMLEVEKRVEKTEQRFEKTEQRVETLEEIVTTKEQTQKVDVTDLRDKLIKMYNMNRQQVPVYLLRPEITVSVEDIYINQEMRFVNPQGRINAEGPGVGRCVSSLREVFYTNDTKCQNIFVSGNAGFGKSTFCHHLINLWCRAHSVKKGEKLSQDVETMAEFAVLFFIDLGDATLIEGNVQNQEELAQLIMAQLNLASIGWSVHDVSELLQSGNVLVVMDALDESRLEKLPASGPYDTCTTLITSRPWKIEDLRFDTKAKVYKDIEITGLAKGSTKRFSKNLVKLLNNQWKKNKKSNDFHQKMDQELLDIEFSNVPVLHMMMLCLWFDDLSFGKSRFEIYRNLVHHQILTAVKLKNLPEHNSASVNAFPLFRYEEPCKKEDCPCQPFGELLQKVSKLAYMALYSKERILITNHKGTVLGLSKYELDICLKIGLLSQYKLLGNVTDNDPQKLLSFTHRTFQEWFSEVYRIFFRDRVHTGDETTEELKRLEESTEFRFGAIWVVRKCAIYGDEIEMWRLGAEERIQWLPSVNWRGQQRTAVRGGRFSQLLGESLIVWQLEDSMMNHRSDPFFKCGMFLIKYYLCWLVKISLSKCSK